MNRVNLGIKMSKLKLRYLNFLNFKEIDDKISKTAAKEMKKRDKKKKEAMKRAAERAEEMTKFSVT